jgi:DNA repair protein RadA/Sms
MPITEAPGGPRTAVFGEVGLAGEVRSVALPDMRLAEAAKLGFTRCLLPAQNRTRLVDTYGLDLVPVRDLAGALDVL